MTSYMHDLEVSSLLMKLSCKVSRPLVLWPVHLDMMYCVRRPECCGCMMAATAAADESYLTRCAVQHDKSHASPESLIKTDKASLSGLSRFLLLLLLKQSGCYMPCSRLDNNTVTVIAATVYCAVR